MQKLFNQILAIFSRSLNRRATSPGGQEPAYRPRQVRRAAEPDIYLRVLSQADRRKFGPLLGASLGTVVIAGFTGPALAQGEEACAFVYELRSAYTVERVLRRFPNDPCIPVLLDTIPYNVLRSVDIDIIRDLPASQLRKVPQDVLEQLGIELQPAAPTTTRAAPRVTRRKTTTSTTNRPGY